MTAPVSTIWVINPNTTEAMTATIAECAGAVIAPGTEVVGITSEVGPPSIESHYDEALCVPGVLRSIERGERQGVDGFVIACFGDPGLDAAREVASGPVVGIAEAAMHAASFLGRRFSVVTTLGRTMGRAADLVERYGMHRACGGIHACELPVLDLDGNPDARKIVTEACANALESDGSDVIVLGCAGMADMCGSVSADLGVPVVDGVAAATLTVQSLVAMGLGTSKRGEFATPPPKRYSAG